MKNSRGTSPILIILGTLLILFLCSQCGLWNMFGMMLRPQQPTVTPDHSPDGLLQDSCYDRFVATFWKQDNSDIGPIYADCKAAKWEPINVFIAGGFTEQIIPNAETMDLLKEGNKHDRTFGEVYVVKISKNYHERLSGSYIKTLQPCPYGPNYDCYVILFSLQHITVEYDPGYEPTPAPTYEPGPTTPPASRPWRADTILCKIDGVVFGTNSECRP